MKQASDRFDEQLLVLDVQEGGENEVTHNRAEPSRLQRATARDSVLKEVCVYVMRQWDQAPTTPEVEPYRRIRDQLKLHQGALFMSGRVVVPPELRPEALGLLHRGHLGMSRMKSKARALIWWPGITKDIEQYAASCSTCAEQAPLPPRVTLQQWPQATHAMERLHTDLTGPAHGIEYLIVLDAYSRYPFVFQLTHSTSAHLIQFFELLFASHGYPQTVVSDNGPQYVSREFENFLQARSIRHILTATYHPQSNGAAERTVRSFKSALEKHLEEGCTSETAITTWLLEYRASQHTTTGASPAVRFLGRELRTPLNVFLATGEWREENAQARQRANYHGRRRVESKQFNKGQLVWVKKGDRNFEPAVIHEQQSATHYYVNTATRGRMAAHVDQLFPRVEVPPPTTAPAVTRLREDNVQSVRL